jgi:hypothetical protein
MLGDMPTLDNTSTLMCMCRRDHLRHARRVHRDGAVGVFKLERPPDTAES